MFQVIALWVKHYSSSEKSNEFFLHKSKFFRLALKWWRIMFIISYFLTKTELVEKKTLNAWGLHYSLIKELGVGGQKKPSFAYLDILLFKVIMVDHFMRWKIASNNFSVSDNKCYKNTCWLQQNFFISFTGKHETISVSSSPVIHG